MGVREREGNQHLTMPPGGRGHLCLSFPVCANPCAAMHCPQQHVAGTLPADSPAGLDECPQEPSVANFPQPPRLPGAQQLSPMLVRFLEFAPEFQEALQIPGKLADPRECSATLKGPCHSHHVPVSLRSHTWGHESFPHSPTAA